MNSRKILQFAVIGAVAFFIGSGARYVFAWTCTGNWCDAKATPPTESIDTPINVGSNPQIKTGSLNVGGDLGIGSDGSKNPLWKLGVRVGSLFIGNVQAWAPDKTVMIGNVPENWSGGNGVVLNVNGKLRVQGGVQGDVLTNGGDGVAVWKTLVPPITNIVGGSYITVTPRTSKGEVTVSANIPPPPSLPGWLRPGSGASNRVPVASANGDVSWRTIRVSANAARRGNVGSEVYHPSGTDPQFREGKIDRAFAPPSFDGGTTLGKLCGLGGYELYVSGTATVKNWSSPGDNGLIFWNGVRWDKKDGSERAHVEGSWTCETPAGDPQISFE